MRPPSPSPSPPPPPSAPSPLAPAASPPSDIRSELDQLRRDLAELHAVILGDGCSGLGGIPGGLGELREGLLVARRRLDNLRELRRSVKPLAGFDALALCLSSVRVRERGPSAVGVEASLADGSVMAAGAPGRNAKGIRSAVSWAGGLFRRGGKYAPDAKGEIQDPSFPETRLVRDVTFHWKALNSADAWHRKLADAKTEVQIAVESGVAADLKKAVARREEVRAEMVSNLRLAQETILRSTGYATVNDLNAAIEKAQEAVAEIEESLRQAYDAATAAGPELGSRAPSPDTPGASSAVAMYTQHKAAFNGQQFVTTTDAAATHLEQAPPLQRYLECDVSPANWAVTFRWTQQAARPAVQHRDAESSDEPFADLAGRLASTMQAIQSEEQFWRSLDPVGALPAKQLFAEALDEEEQREGGFAFLRQAKEVYASLAEEIAREDRLVRLLQKEVVDAERELENALERNLDAQDNLEDAATKLRQYADRGKDTKALEDGRADARIKAQEADASLQPALNVLAEFAADFPEVTGMPALQKKLGACFLGASLPRELLPLWGGFRSLHQFDTRTVIKGDHRHKVEQVSLAGKEYVVKEYRISEAADLKTCAREAALLLRLRHDHVVELTGLFVDIVTKSLYLQMQFYSEGTLDQWVTKCKPDDSSVRRACAQALSALAHFHALQVVHSDVKPANIFMDALGKAYLGDLDVSVESATRCSTKHATERATSAKVSYTIGFDAPELLKTGATTKSDVFAFGATLCVPGIVAEGPARNALASLMKAQDPKKRLSAKEALQDVFFTAVLRYIPEERHTCIVCYESKPSTKGVVCGRSHFVCAGCLDSYVEEELSMLMASAEALARHRASGGLMPCPACKDVAVRAPNDAGSFYEDLQLYQGLSKEVFRGYSAAKDQATEDRIWKDQQELFNIKLAKLQEEYRRRGVAQLAAENEAATLQFLRRSCPNAVQCPSCGLGPVLPEGCFDLGSHHGEARARGGFVSNACRGCGFFSRERSAWARWDGNMRG
ncbi:unnamed protein product [Polarella glacialis]|uniref:non-specific serine/threonine protein kinase n=1 Tax=Polarella glacialis TaxID=89957 RepID=A0A813HUS3_POLGL|nr:unnamed protein product [Polarella glacialis]